jgi:hypothetical protein
MPPFSAPFPKILDAKTLQDAVETVPLSFEDNREVPLGHIADEARFLKENFKAGNHKTN